MVGGDPHDVRSRARPILECNWTRTRSSTAVPEGPELRTKLVNNYLSIVSNVVVAEALAIAEGAGLDRDIAIEVLMGTTAGRGHLATTYPAKVLAGDLEPGFAVDLARKDLGLALQMPAPIATPPEPWGWPALPFYDSAQYQGMGRMDWTTIYNLVRESRGPSRTAPRYA